ncbi:DegT/DnrJ/EryC1/StrS family aminotransferase [Fulvivirga sp. 29W222]|uniref:DegT/DnrJ/EryC1/StrS family aminotransferase n=1 Tax=Fulvivirga marina TaxID=2494733 RepID=A0A937FZI9_9BACT|nr:DegT/DnrJ/EryC1/StrS family aminotransferase [Fulvivirga marina]MBL6445766.1 DegT/DnrJ/EryC1/StrS family aminotransferase [Fulvivirga marina]
MKIPVSKPVFWKNEEEYVNQAMQEGWISSKGRFIDQFEKDFASQFNYQYASTVSNGTNALHLALDVLGLGEGDEIIIPDFTMMAPVFAILQAGAIPVPVDVDYTWNIDVGQIENYITDKTKAILVVHNYGHPANMPLIKSICDRHKLLLMEDCAEVIGAKVGDQYVGSWGDASCFSFYANKIITTGEGGMIVTNNKELYEKAHSRKNMAFGCDNQSRFNHSSVGFNYRMTNLQAALGVAQLEFVEQAIAKKIHIAQVYKRLLADIDGLELPCEETWAKNVYWVFGIVITEGFGCSRNTLQDLLEEKGIETRNFFTPIHQQQFLKGYTFPGKYSNSRKLGENGLYLPSYMDLSDDEIEEVCSVILQIHRNMK